MKSYAAVFQSGSNGNCLVVGRGSKRIVIDCGISISAAEKYGKVLGFDIFSSSALLITHLHGDHINIPFFKKAVFQGIPVYMGTELQKKEFVKTYPGLNSFTEKIKIINGRHEVEEFEINSFSVSHDAPGGSVGYTVGYNDNGRVSQAAVLTDIGSFCKNSEEHLFGSNLIIIEANYDEELLNGSNRPFFIKKRIRNTHLSNKECGAGLKKIISSRGWNPETVLLAHISSECNTADEAEKIVREYICGAEAASIDIVSLENHLLPRIFYFG